MLQKIQEKQYTLVLMVSLFSCYFRNIQGQCSQISIQLKMVLLSLMTIFSWRMLILNTFPHTNWSLLALSQKKKLNDQIYKLFHQNVCINYLSVAESYKCDQELLNAGLETVTIQILEKSRDLLSTFRKSSQDKN